MRQAGDFSAPPRLGSAVPLNRKERRRLAAQSRQPPPACSCCRPKDEPVLAGTVSPDSESPA